MHGIIKNSPINKPQNYKVTLLFLDMSYGTKFLWSKALLNLVLLCRPQKTQIVKKWFLFILPPSIKNKAKLKISKNQYLYRN